MKASLLDYYRALRKHYGPQNWWPAESPFEVMVGAILAQNTSWENVERAIATLKVHDLLEPRRLHELDVDTLALAIRSSGTFRVKARRLKEFLRWYVAVHGADEARLRAMPAERLRQELLGLRGIGPETADAILLYALNVPTFVVDRYTYRMLARHGLVADTATYDEMKELFERALPRDPSLFNELHALIVRVGKDYCRATARCERCPLRRYLPGERSRES
ncbi:MAG: endonuclease III domain-containing protein [Planctomycetes bacterium]|nr:endonuclease III domain-containing protein [Planctomycetota bacterium]